MSCTEYYHSHHMTPRRSSMATLESTQEFESRQKLELPEPPEPPGMGDELQGLDRPHWLGVHDVLKVLECGGRKFVVPSSVKQKFDEVYSGQHFAEKARAVLMVHGLRVLPRISPYAQGFKGFEAISSIFRQ